MAQDHEPLHAEPLVLVATKRIEGVGAVALTTSGTSEISPERAVGEQEEPMCRITTRFSYQQKVVGSTNKDN
jgi:hypothetical protein